MKTKARWLTAGIAVTYVLMCFPWALKTIWDVGVTYHWLRYPLGTVMGDPLSSLSALLAFSALIVSLFSTFGRVRRPHACGILLLFSTVIEIVNGCVFGFERFTALTYCIIALLIGLGLLPCSASLESIKMSSMKEFNQMMRSQNIFQCIDRIDVF